jgi:Bacteriophage head to tail connecting protein
MPLDSASSSSQAYYERASATLLSREPATISLIETARPDSAWPDYFGVLEARLSSLRDFRISWWRHWSLLAAYILPRRYKYLVSANITSRGQMLNQNILDSTPTLAMRTCASGMMSGLTSPNRPWFRLKSAIAGFEPDRAAQMWFDDVTERMRFVHSESNFYDSLAQMYQDLVTFGTAPVIDYEDEEDVIRCYNPCAGEYYLAVSPAFREESFYREFTLTTAQTVEMFGLENCPGEVRSQWMTKGGSLEQERVIAHAIEPNFAIQGRNQREVRLLPETWTWREVYWIRGVAGERPLSKRGFNEQPFVAPRWDTTSNDAYGRSPGMDALPDCMQLMTMTKREAEAIEKQVRPPMLAHVNMKNEPSSILPGNITYSPTMGPGEGIRPIFTVQPNLAEFAKSKTEIQNRIKQAFFNDLFLMISQLDTVRTATEIDARREEKLILLGPVIERIQNEGLSPRIRRQFSIMARKRLLPPLPRSLQGVPIQIEYVSMLAMAQRATATTGLERAFAFAGNLAGSYPQVLDVFNPDEAAREYADLLGTSPKILQDSAVIEKIRANRAQQQQQQQAMATTAAGVQGAQVLSQTPVGAGQTALSKILGTEPSQGTA